MEVGGLGSRDEIDESVASELEDGDIKGDDKTTENDGRRDDGINTDVGTSVDD